jgi:hypothetical protein
LGKKRELWRFTHLSDDEAVAKMGHPVLWMGKGVGREVGFSVARLTMKL